MRIRIDHSTSYRYQLPASHVVQYLRLSPSDTDDQHVRNWRIDVDADGKLRESRDSFGNRMHIFYADGAVTELNIHVTGIVDVEDSGGVVRGAFDPLPPSVFLRTTPLTTPDAAIRALADASRQDSPLETVHALNLAIFGALIFETGTTNTATSATDAFGNGRGVCQDFAHIFCSASRMLGIPARYVSGHLARSGAAARQDASHAWAEAYLPDLGWLAFDAANGICADQHYVRVAVGLDYLDAAPVRGARRGGGGEVMEVSVRAVEGQAQRQQ